MDVLQGEEELDQNEKKKLRKLKAVEESDDEEEGKDGRGANLSRFFTRAARLIDSLGAFRVCFT